MTEYHLHKLRQSEDEWVEVEKEGDTYSTVTHIKRM